MLPNVVIKQVPDGTESVKGQAVKKITVEQVLALKPCEEYTPERLHDLMAEGLTPLEICDLDSVPVLDRMWVLLRLGVIDDHNLRLLACKWAERVLPIFEKAYPDDDRPRNTIAVSRRFANGDASKEELAAAKNDAWDATSAAAARAAAWTAAMAATRAATRAATGSAAWSATGFTAKATQLADVREVLEAMDDLASARLTKG